MKIIGIDCATDPKRIGLASASGTSSNLKLEYAQTGAGVDVARIIVEWMQNDSVLIAMDAPLGWPAPMGELLQQHKAGQSLAIEANNLFRRETDRFVKARTGKLPLDVGADRIARTAHAALDLLRQIQELTGEAIPMAWNPTFTGKAVIEVYPAVTLMAHGLPYLAYKDAKKDSNRLQRKTIVKGLSGLLSITSQQCESLLANADVLDAVLCCVAGSGFLQGRVLYPQDKETAEKEGWIWIPDTY